jgi:hypothetical protein
MNETAGHRWYTEPESFIAIAALIVSISAVAVGLYEASLQRHHDRAEVWPHVEIQIFTKPTGANILVENTGIGPAIIQSAMATVDGRPARNWADVLQTLNGVEPSGFGHYTIVRHGLRPGDHTVVIDLPVADLPHDFWKSIARVGFSVCYSSVFDQYWVVEVKKFGGPITWREVSNCAPQPANTEF